MSDNIILILCLAAIIISIVVSNIWKVNMGFLAMSFAFIIGCLVQGKSASTIYGYWPDNIAFFLMACCLFFGYARENGTLQTFGNKLLYKFKDHTLVIPWVIFAISAILGYMGTGSGTIFIIAPVAYIMGAQIGLDPLVTACAVNMGYVCGGWNPWTGTGVILYGLMEENGMDTALATATYFRAYGLWLVRAVLLFALVFCYFTFFKKKAKGNNEKSVRTKLEMEKPDDFTPIQKKTFRLILIAVVLIVIPNVINSWFKVDSVLFKNLVKLCKPQAICIIFALIASSMKLADTKKVLAKLPMNTIIMISGICFLMTIATDANLVEVIANWFESNNIASWLIFPILVILSGVLSFFSSATGVVCPLLFPLVPALSAATGLNAVGLYAAIMSGADTTSLSPFSTAGSQLVALAPEEQQEAMIPRQFVTTWLALAAVTILAAVGYFGLLKI